MKKMYIMETSNVLSIIAIGISLISIIWNAISYFKFDKPLKQMDIETKRIEIAKHKKEEEDKKKAIIKGEFLYQGEGKYYHFSIINEGKCVAKNVVIHLPKEHIDVISPIGKIDILPSNQPIIYRVSPTYKCKNIVMAEFQWDDDFGEKRHSIEPIVVPHVVQRVFN